MLTAQSCVTLLQSLYCIPDGATSSGSMVCANDTTASLVGFGLGKQQSFPHDNNASRMMTIDKSRNVCFVLYLRWMFVSQLIQSSSDDLDHVVAVVA